MTTRGEVQRIVELLDQGIAAGDGKEDIVRRIFKEMPHLTADDVADVAAVHAEECRLDASVHRAQAQAAEQIADIIRETQQMSGRPHLNTGEALLYLNDRAEKGDKRASKLLVDFSEAALIVGLDE
jgi:hypothetical protein